VSLSTRIEEIERQLEALAKQLPAVARLRSVPGIGLLTATALYAFVGDITRFPSGRHLASYLGLTPR
jgi:transposase